MSEVVGYAVAAVAGGVAVSILDYVRKGNLISSLLRLVGGAKMVLVKAEKAVANEGALLQQNIKKVI